MNVASSGSLALTSAPARYHRSNASIAKVCRVPDYAGFIDGAILFVQAVAKLALADSA
jgi:hypothetical protein